MPSSLLIKHFDISNFCKFCKYDKPFILFIDIKEDDVESFR